MEWQQFIAKEASMSGGVVQPVPVDLCDLAAVRAGIDRGGQYEQGKQKRRHFRPVRVNN